MGTATQTKTIKVTGAVTAAESSKPLPGASIMLKGSKKGARARKNGVYSIEVPGNATLVVSYTGYQTREIAVNNRAIVDVGLNAAVKELEDVVVVGYGTQRKRDLTGAVTSLAKKDLVPVPAANSFDQMMQGKVAGVQINQTSGAPGGNVNMVLRGINSITGGSQPLYVIDGYPIGSGGGGSELTGYSSDSYSVSGIMGVSGVNRVNPLSSINPADIESIEVLKDASATAIYGSRGANGVIIVTTKRGKGGVSSVNFEHSSGIQEVQHQLDLLTPQEYAEFVAEGRDNAWVFSGGNASDPNDVRDGTSVVKPAFRNPEQFAGKGTNWQDVIFRRALVQNYQLSVTGNKETINYAISGGYMNQKGIIIGSDFKKFNLRANLDVELNKKVKIGTSFAGTHNFGDFARAEGDIQYRGLIASAIGSDPTIPVYDENGGYYSEFSDPLGIPVEHPLIIADNFSDKRKNSNVFSNSYVEYKPIEELTLKSTVGVNYNTSQSRVWKSSKIGLATSRTGTALAASTRINTMNWLNENTASYQKTFNDVHRIDAVVGFTIQKNQDDIMQAGASDFPTDDIHLIGGGVVSSGTDYTSEWTMLSWLGRVNYTYADKYLLTATVRRDGSSRFGTKNRWGTFPSVSLAYRLSEENFLKDVKAIDELKVRASYGVAGNNLIGNYASLALYGMARTVSDGSIVLGVTPSTMANDLLGWEKSHQVNVGLDASFFDSRVNLTADFYRSHKKDLLLTVGMPPITGVSTSIQNIGELENKGLELTLHTQNINGKDFRWSSDATFSVNRNKVLALHSANGVIKTSDFQVAQVGYPISSFQLLNILGVFQTADEVANSAVQAPQTQPGDYRFEDVNQDGKIDMSDRTIVGDPWPDFTWGFGNQFSYKAFSLGISIYGSHGGELYFQGGSTSLNGAGVQNQLDLMNDRWRSPENPGNGEYARAIRNDYALGINAYTTKYLFDASFVRIKNINLSYTLPQSLVERWKLKSLSVFADVSNVYTFTDYPGFDPEASTGGDNVARTGVDFYSYPVPRTYSLGVRASF
ncbi:TonB-dependent receptor [Olivibacter ginsenosidimutans]|uniref:TonB-dependent receptor n=1 Tax=Olivibacter ginsenosidimutans TaxID=1176537 RepID=A0ABP9BRP1_9SPHI